MNLNHNRNFPSPVRTSKRTKHSLIFLNAMSVIFSFRFTIKFPLQLNGTHGP